MRTAPSATLARHWIPERSLLSERDLVIGFSPVTWLIAISRSRRR